VKYGWEHTFAIKRPYEDCCLLGCSTV
jgi:hypothetical protein